MNGLLFENYGDAPFTKGKVGELTVSAFTKVVLSCVNGTGLPFGINVLRNDWRSALSIAAVTGASFIRVNVLSGAYATDQGIIEGDAAQCLRLRRELEHEFGRKILIFADVHTKHGSPIVDRGIEEATKDLVERALPDCIIVTGSRTGSPPDIAEVKTVVKAASDVPVLIGSGMNPQNIKSFSEHAQGFIVGTSLKEMGLTENAPQLSKVKALLGSLRE